MKLHQLILLLSLTLTSIAQSQCNCDHTLTGLSTTNVNIIYASSFTYAPGDTFCIQADTIAGLRLIGFQGSSSEPLTFINCGGKVAIDAPAYPAISFRESNFIHLTGTGDSQTEYGIHIIHTNSGTVGAEVGYLSSDFEIDHLEIENTGFAGIMAKTDPNCSDSSTWRSNGYILNNLEIHNNYIHDVEGEGMYIGYTGGYKVTSNVICDSNYVFGHWLKNVNIHNNLIENAGWDGIQVNLARSNAQIHHNTLINWGLEEVTYQDFAMSIGGGDYSIYNNYMLNEPGNPGKGIQFIGVESGSKLFNNVFINPRLHGAFIHMRYEFEDSLNGYFIGSNTVINPEKSGFFYNTVITQSYDSTLIGHEQNAVPTTFVNNFISSPGSDYEGDPTWKGEQESFFDFISPAARDAQMSTLYTNIMTRNIDTIGVVDTLNYDFRAASMSSYLVDNGSDVSIFGVTFDFDDVPRPQNNLYDIGAFEFSTAEIIGFDAENDRFKIYPVPAMDELKIEPKHHTMYSVRVYSNEGQLLIQRERLSSLEVLNLSNLTSGMYFLEILDENNFSFQNRFVKL